MIELALFLHLMGGFAFVAGSAVAAVGFEAARRREQAREVALLLGSTRIGVALVGVGALLLLGCGAWLVHLEGIGWRARWIDGALVLFAVASVLGALGGRTPKRARKLAERSEGAVSDELRALLDDRAARLLNYASGVVTVAIVVLMVWKPA